MLATCWTSAGDAASDRPDLRSPLTLRERIEAASTAGFRGFGLLSADLPTAEQESAAEVLGARHIKLTPDGDDAPWDPEHWAAKFAELAAEAHDAGTRPGIEFFPWSNIKTLHDGLRLNDADPEVVGTLFEDTVHRRRYRGEGSFDLPGMITALRAAGWAGPWGVEILSEQHRKLDVREASAKAYATAFAEIERASDLWRDTA